MTHAPSLVAMSEELQVAIDTNRSVLETDDAVVMEPQFHASVTLGATGRASLYLSQFLRR